MAGPSHPTPRVTVCIPTYRGASHIRNTIDSVLAQTFHDFELVIIDNASPDDTFAIASSYRDPRVRCLRNAENLGAEGNWNRCLAEATGEYIKLLPDDDVLARECLQQQVEVFDHDAGQELAMVFCARVIIDGRGHPRMERRTFGRQRRRLARDEIFRQCLRRGTNVIGEPGGVMFRRDLARRVGGFDATYGYVVDLDYWLRLLAHGDGCYLPDLLVSFRVAPGAWSVAVGNTQAAEFIGLMTHLVNERRSFRASALDLAMARAVALGNNVARRLLYRFVFRGA